MNAVLLAIGIYILAQLVVGAAVSRRIRGEEDYILAGRSIGFVLATFSIFATWFGAETCMGSAGAIYEHGLSGAARDPFAYTGCLLLMGLVFAVPLRRREFSTLGDLFARRYSPAVERVAVVIMVPTSILWAAAQIRAFGQVLSASSELELDVTMTIATGVVILYSVAGGLLADVITDLVQGVVLAVGMIALLVVVMFDVGDIAGTTRAIEPRRLSIFAEAASAWESVETWMVPICGSVVAQELIARVLACRTPSVARRACLAATGLYLSIGLIPTFLGLVGPHLLHNLSDPEQFLPKLAQQHLGTALYILFIGALVSAILSTIDSALLAASALVSENLVGSLRHDLSSRTKLRISRGGVVAFGLIAYGLALASESVFGLVEQASAFGSSGVFTVVVFGLMTRFGGPVAALASLVCGTGVWMFGHYSERLAYPYITSLAAAVVAYGLIGLVERVTPRAVRPAE
jgi:Na+/proline symporter